MLVVTSASPEVSNLLGLDLGDLERLTVQGRGGHLKDRQRGGQVIESLSDTRDRRDQRGQAEISLAGHAGWLRNDGRAQKSSGKGNGLHDGQQRGSSGRERNEQVSD